jgi:hypothetical protein
VLLQHLPLLLLLLARLHGQAGLLLHVALLRCGAS